ncbi:MAG: flippase-like domain-containing protein [Blautia sp.]|nr:flippase-like domain-containing protein [Blautia sp.]
MKKKKRVLFNGLFFFAIFGLTLWLVFRGEDLSEIQDAIRGADRFWLLMAVGCVVLYIWGESIILWFLMRSCKIHIRQELAFLIAAVGYFFSCVTPSATGGQPMQIYFLKKERIPISVSSVLLLLITIIYKLVLVVLGLGILLFGHSFAADYMEGMLPVFYLGIFLNVITITALGMLVFCPSLVRLGLTKGVAFLEKKHILKHKENRLARLDESMDSYQDTAEFVKNHVKLVIQLFIITVLQRAALFAVPYMIYRSFHLSGTKWTTILLLQATISVSVDMLPLPGGMGASETLFLQSFEPVFGELILPGMVLSRGLGYYTELLLSAVFTMVAVVVFARRAAKKVS